MARALSCSDVIEPGRTRDSSISDDRSSVTLQRHRGHCNDYSGDGITRLQGFVGSSHCQARWISTEPVQTLARKTLDWLAIRVPFNALTIPRRLEAAWHRLACGGQHQPRYKTWSLQLWILLYPFERRCARIGIRSARAGSTRRQADRAQLSQSLSTGVLAGSQSQSVKDIGSWGLGENVFGHKLLPVDVLAPIGIGQSMLICGPKVRGVSDRSEKVSRHRKGHFTFYTFRVI